MFLKSLLAIGGFVASTVALALPSPKFVSVSGQNIAYYESTGTHGPGILIVPGNSTTAKSFDDILNRPFAKWTRVVVMELPGTGNSSFDSSNPQTTYSVTGLAGIIDGTATALNLDDGVIAGWSAGGNAILQAVGANLLQNAKGYFIWGTPPVTNPFDPNAFLPNPAGAYAFTPVLTPTEAQTLANAYLRPGQTAPSFFANDILATDPNFRAYLGQSLFTGQYMDETQIVANMTKPLAIVHGAQDQLANLTYIQSKTYATLWRGAVQMVPVAGHAAHFERPLIFGNYLRQFYNDVTP